MTRRHDIGPIVEGDTYQETLVVKDEGERVNLLDWRVVITVKRHVDDTAVIEEIIDNHDNPESGETSFRFSPAQTEGLSDEYAYDIKITTADGEVATVLYGNMRFIEGVTS